MHDLPPVGDPLEEVRLPSTRGDVPVWIATPTTPPPWPGVVIIHDALGRSRDLERQARWMASEGFLAAAPNLYHFGGKMRCMASVIKDILRQDGPAFDDVDAVRAWLDGRDDCTGRIGVIGYCLGGGFAVALAPGRGFSVVSANYGGVPKDALTFLEGACPIIGSYGALDTHLLEDAERLRTALETLDIPHDVKVYDDTDHAFMNDHEGDELPLFLEIIAKLGGGEGAFHPASAADARQRVANFFHRHLDEAAGS
jgi:carboxymethylenebutenolidase